jgi:hypothetical protein
MAYYSYMIQELGIQLPFFASENKSMITYAQGHLKFIHSDKLNFIVQFLCPVKSRVGPDFSLALGGKSHRISIRQLLPLDVLMHCLVNILVNIEMLLLNSTAEICDIKWMGNVKSVHQGKEWHWKNYTCS